MHRRGSVHATARHTGFNPSHISKVLSRLEAKAGHALLFRSPSGVGLTNDGKAFLEIARQILGKAAPLYGTGPSEAPSPKQETITVGAVSLINRQLIAPSIHRLAAMRPHVTIRLVDLGPDDVLSTVMNGGFDAAVSIGKLVWTRNWSSVKIGDLRWALLASVHHPLGRRATVDQVMKYPFVVPCYWQKDGFAIGNDHCPLPWSRRRKGHEVSSAETAANVVVNTDNLAFVPRIIARSMLQYQELTEIKVSGWKPLKKPLYLTVHVDRVAKSLQKDLVASLRASQDL